MLDGGPKCTCEDYPMKSSPEERERCPVHNAEATQRRYEARLAT